MAFGSQWQCIVSILFFINSILLFFGGGYFYNIDNFVSFILIPIGCVFFLCGLAVCLYSILRYEKPEIVENESVPKMVRFSSLLQVYGNSTQSIDEEDESSPEDISDDSNLDLSVDCKRMPYDDIPSSVDSIQTLDEDIHQRFPDKGDREKTNMDTDSENSVQIENIDRDPPEKYTEDELSVSELDRLFQDRQFLSEKSSCSRRKSQKSSCDRDEMSAYEYRDSAVASYAKNDPHEPKRLSTFVTAEKFESKKLSKEEIQETTL